MQLFHSPLGPDAQAGSDGQPSQRDRVLLYLFSDKEEADAFWRRVPEDAVSRLHRAVLPSPVVFSAIDRLLDTPSLGGPDGKLGGMVVNPAQDSAIFLPTHAVRAADAADHVAVGAAVVGHVVLLRRAKSIPCHCAEPNVRHVRVRTAADGWTGA